MHDVMETCDLGIPKVRDSRIKSFHDAMHKVCQEGGGGGGGRGGRARVRVRIPRGIQVFPGRGIPRSQVSMTSFLTPAGNK